MNADRMLGMPRFSLKAMSGRMPIRSSAVWSLAAPTLLMGTLMLGACAPAPARVSPPVQSNTVPTSVSFYPQETGLNWAYVPEGESTASAPYVLRALGPTVFGGQTALAFQLTGRGADQTWYRLISSSGVRLLGFRKPGVTVTLSPAWIEAPAETAWRVGLTWEGTTTARVSSDDGKVQSEGLLRYRYDVQDRRRVSTPGGSFDVWVITRQISGELGSLFPAAQQLWFTPFVGDIRTPEALLLTARNFASPALPGGTPTGGQP
ncbi:hypothetical protein ACFFLM_10425 [Deinococcus oregonensis]|uniref:Lipoprotein n=1 Tax=Deinococcus oregonensis TaxID=1805970 RepID=A0ABV6AXZ8_9DEIO